MQLGVDSESLELRILPNSNIDLSNLHIANMQGSTLSFTVPSSSGNTTAAMQSDISQDTPNLNSVASHSSPRAGWAYQYKLN